MLLCAVLLPALFTVIVWVCVPAEGIVIAFEPLADVTPSPWSQLSPVIFLDLYLCVCAPEELLLAE